MQLKSFQLYSIHFNLIQQTITNTRNLKAFMLAVEKSVMKIIYSLPSGGFYLLIHILGPKTVAKNMTELSIRKLQTTGQPKLALIIIKYQLIHWDI